MDREEKELQIKLAQLQTDVQIYLTIALSFMAVLFSLIISFQQLYLQAIESSQRYFYLFGLILSGALVYFVVRIYIRKMQSKREEMESLKKQYVW